LSAIEGYKIPFICEPSQYHVPSQPMFTDSENRAIDEIIDSLLSSGAIVKVQLPKVKFLSKIFVVPKSDGRYRLILNLKDLNQYLPEEHFKMEDYRSVCNLMTNNAYMGKIDLKDAYHLIPMHPDFYFYLCFSWRNKYYHYSCVPFGLASAPRLFTKILRPVLSYLRKQNFESVGFLDDFLLKSDSFVSCLSNIAKTKHTLESLGWLINFEKSVLIPCKRIQYLGFIFDSQNMSIELPLEKRLNVINICEILLKANYDNKLTILQAAKVIGTLVSVCPAIPYGELYVRQLEFEKQRSLIANSGDFNRNIKFSNEAIRDINWWITTIQDKIKSLTPESFSFVITTDASLSGWGAHMGTNCTRGFWSHEEAKLHINILELKAICYSLQAFANDKSNCRILIRSDSTTAISYINKYGGTRSCINHCIAKLIWQWCERRNIFIHASYISTKANILADKLSRSLIESTDFKLKRSVFKKITGIFGVPKLDLFASPLTSQCDRFVSWFPQPGAQAIDAFTIPWKEFYYAFPPFLLIPRFLRKARHEKTCGIVVVPNWPSQCWFPTIMQLFGDNFIHINSEKDLLICPFSKRNHVLSKHSLIAGIIFPRDTLL